MMRSGLFILAGMLSYIFFLLLQFPAQHALSHLAPEDFPLSAGGISGTIWKGSAKQAFFNGQALGSTDWQFLPLSLVIGQAEYEFGLTDKNEQLHGQVALSILSGGVTLSGLKGAIGAQKLAGLIEQPALRLRGILDLNIRELRLSEQGLTRANGTVRWSHAMVTSPIQADLGELQFNITGDDDLVTLQVEDIDGPVKLAGNLKLKPDGSYQIQGNIKQNAPNAGGFGNILQNIGRILPDGSTQIDYQGQL